MITMILLALVGTVLAAVVGSFWYSPNTPMGKIHMKYLGFDKLSQEEQKAKMEKMKPMMPKMYTAQMVLSFLTAFATVMIMTMTVKGGVPVSMAAVFPIVNWLCFMVPVIGSGIIWGNTNKEIAWKKFFSDSAENLVVILLIELLVSFFV